MTKVRADTLREASARDVGGLVRLINRAYEVEKRIVRGDRIDAEQTRAHLRSGTFLVVEGEVHSAVPAESPAIAGCVWIEHRRGGRGYWGLLSVDPDCQGRGLARPLVAAAEALCRRRGHEEIEILVIDQRSELFPFYDSLGYAAVERRPFPDNGRALVPLEFVVMVRALE